MIKFSFVTLEGFGSFLKPFTYHLDSPGINLITGRNGAGKTTIFSALSWCLYGQTLKEKAEITPWDDVAKDYKGTRVEVRIQIGLEDINVVRYKDYSGKAIDGKAGGNRLLLYVNSKLQPIKDKKEVQARIIEILGMSFNLFKNSIAFGQNLTRLMRESGPKQKELFDEAFEVTYINKAREKAAQYYSELKEKDNKLFIDCKHIDDLIKETKQTDQAYEEAKKEAKEGIKEVIKDLEENSKKLRALGTPKEIKEVDGLRNTFERKVAKLKELENKHFKLDFTHEQEKAQTKALERECSQMVQQSSTREPVCDRCGQVIKGSGITAYREQQRERLRSKRATLSTRRRNDKEREEKLAQLSSSIKKLQKFKQRLKELDKTLEEEKINAKLRQEYLSARPKLKARLKTLRARVFDMRERLAASPLPDLEAQKEVLVEQHFKLEKELKLHKWLIEDPLSNKGLKAFIFKAMLENINTNLKKYGTYLGYAVRFNVDLESGNKNFEALMYSREGHIRTYESLSGGQKQLLDIALAFAIHDTVTDTKNLNILLMDEVFESLDADNVELVSELIQHKSQGISIHLISHQSSLVFSKVTKTTQLKLSNGTTAVL